MNIKKLFLTITIVACITLNFVACSSNDSTTDKNGSTVEENVDKNTENLKDDIVDGAKDVKDDIMDTPKNNSDMNNSASDVTDGTNNKNASGNNWKN